MVTAALQYKARRTHAAAGNVIVELCTRKGGGAAHLALILAAGGAHPLAPNDVISTKSGLVVRPRAPLRPPDHPQKVAC